MRIGVISDTHVPVRARALPGAVFDIFAGVDLILHAGDLITLDVLAELQTIAPVLAVHGNVDRPEVIERLTASLRLEVKLLADGGFKVEASEPGAEAGFTVEVAKTRAGGEASVKSSEAGADDERQVLPDPGGKAWTIGLVHGHEGVGRTTPERAASHFPDAAIVVFGHSHQPLNEWRDGHLLFNPGSATDPRRAPSPSVGILELGDAVNGKIIWM